MRQIDASALLVLFTLACCSPPSAAEPCGGFTDMRLYVACLQNQISSGCGHACETNMIQCPQETYPVADYCVPKSKMICPNKTVYTNGTCQVYEKPSCPQHFTLNNGVCVGLVPDHDCKQNSTNCTIITNHCQGLFGKCDHPTTCTNGLILFNGTCVSQNIAKCRGSMTLVNGICVRQKLPCENTGNCTRLCPTESKMVNGTCVRISSCPNGSFQIGGLCAKCPLGSFYAVGECLSCPPYMLYEDDLCVCPGDTILFNNTCMENPSTIGPDSEGSGDGTSDRSLNPIEPETNDGGVGGDDDDIDYWLSVTTETPNHHTTEKAVRGDQPLGPFTYTHIFNVTENTNLEDSSEETEESNECCLIIEPIQCKKIGLKYRCIKRRHHACGGKCKEEQTKETFNPYNLIEPRSSFAMDSLLSRVPLEQNINNQHQQYLSNNSLQHISAKQDTFPVTQSVNLIYNHDPIGPNTPIHSAEVATTITKPAISREYQTFIPLNTYRQPNMPITQPKLKDIKNPFVKYDQFKILLNYDQSETYNQPKLMNYRLPMRDQQIINHQPIKQQSYQQPLQEQNIINHQQLMNYQHPLQEQHIINHQPIQQLMNYQQPLQEQHIITHQPIQQLMNYQQPLQEQHIINHQPIQQSQLFYQQPLQEQQIIHNQPMQWQQMFYQQPLQEQNIFYQQPIQDQQLFNQQSILEQTSVYYQQPMQERQITFQQPLQEQPNTFQQFFQAEQQPILGQEHQLIYQQPMEEQVMYQQQQFIGPANCNVCP